MLISPTMEVNVDSCASSGNGGNQDQHNNRPPSRTTYGSKKLKKNKSGVSTDKPNQSSSKKLKKKGSASKQIRASRLSTQEGEGGIPGVISSCEREREGGVRSSMQMDKKAKSQLGVNGTN